MSAEILLKVSHFIARFLCSSMRVCVCVCVCASERVWFVLCAGKYKLIYTYYSYLSSSSFLFQFTQFSWVYTCYRDFLTSNVFTQLANFNMQPDSFHYRVTPFFRQNHSRHEIVSKCEELQHSGFVRSLSV